MNDIVKALRERYPHLGQQEAEQIAQGIVNGTAARLTEGSHLGAIEILPNGDINLSIIHVTEDVGEDGGDGRV